jgi:2-polyprenyl-3-methyl-5-hydroxy-6-metoxy-1,4-benzoquinol methylase
MQAARSNGEHACLNRRPGYDPTQTFERWFELVGRVLTTLSKVITSVQTYLSSRFRFNPSRKVRIPRTGAGGNLHLSAPLNIDGFKFSKLSMSTRGDTLWGPDDSDTTFLKIGLAHLSGKKLNNLAQEAEIVKELSDKGAISSPKFISTGTLEADELPKHLVKDSSSQFHYLLTRNVKSASSFLMADLILSILEQKALGVYQGDLKPSNLAFDDDLGVLVILDYDQAVRLGNHESNMGNLEYLDWTFEQERVRYSHDSWLRHFGRRGKSNQVVRLFRDNSFNLAETTLYKRQKTTNTSDGVYHTLDTPTLYADGVRDLRNRSRILDGITFAPGERILDVGCNVGLLAHYLFDRGCQATGYELDPHIVTAAKMVANILQKRVDFATVDLDEHHFTDDFDTIFLFSVFHHTQNIVSNGIKLASACNRIIIECRLKENGKKPRVDSTAWDNASAWNFGSLESLHRGLENYFPNFKLHRNHGLVDKERYVIELRKTVTSS